MQLEFNDVAFKATAERAQAEICKVGGFVIG